MASKDSIRVLYLKQQINELKKENRLLEAQLVLLKNENLAHLKRAVDYQNEILDLDRKFCAFLEKRDELIKEW